MSRKRTVYYDGSRWLSEKFGWITVVGKSDRKGFYRCRFDYDGYEKDIHVKSIKYGSFKNPNIPIIYGVGYCGEGKHKPIEDKKRYNCWIHMLSRCYNHSSDKHPTYKGVVVDDRWHNFQNFCDDIIKLSGYKEWLNAKPNEYSLDKDVLCERLKIYPKVYSKETCMFLTQTDNILEMNKRLNISKTPIYAIRLEDGCVEEFYNQHDFELKHGVGQGDISAILRKNSRKIANGWTFVRDMKDFNKDDFKKDTYTQIDILTGEKIKILDLKNFVSKNRLTMKSITKNVKNESRHYNWKKYYVNGEINKTEFRLYIGVRLHDGYSEKFVNQSEFARKYNLLSGKISECLMRKRHTHKGWRFEELPSVYR